MSLAPLTAIPSHLITGFLGAGKTTVIRHLLSIKPEAERWAVLVNEFGRIGLDGPLLGQGNGEDGGVFIRQVAGGCMCCAQGVATRVALTQLLRTSRPHRLFIEPSGLAHPQAILAQIATDFSSVLQLKAVLTLVDITRWAELRRHGPSLFHEQVALADRLVAVQADRASAQQCEGFAADCRASGRTDTQWGMIANGQLPLAWLDEPHCPVTSRRLLVGGHFPSFLPQSGAPAAAADVLCDADGIARLPGSAADGWSFGWQWDGRWCWPRAALHDLLAALALQRIKAVMLTDGGWWLFNGIPGQLQGEPWRGDAQPATSCVEILNTQPLAAHRIESQLRQLALPLSAPAD